MFSKPVAKCWVCPAEFARKRELKNHLAAAPHSRLRVVCVWCTDEEKVFRRMVDLKQHVFQTHPKVIDDIPADFFGELNGFWMALHPRDYNQIVGASPKESKAAVQARVKLLIWVGKCKNTSKSRLEWQTGWESGIGGNKRSSGTLFFPVNVGTREKERVQDDKVGVSTELSESTFIPDYEDLDTIMAPPYSPSRPEIKRKLVIHHIKMSAKGSTVELFDNINHVWYKVEISCQDERDACSLVRKMIAIRPDSCRAFPEGTGSNETSEDLKKDIANLLGVSKGRVETMARFMPATFGPSRKRKESPPETSTAKRKETLENTLSKMATQEPSPHQAVKAPESPTVTRHIHSSSEPLNVPSSTQQKLRIPELSMFQSPSHGQNRETTAGTPVQDECILDLSMKHNLPVIPGSNQMVIRPQPTTYQERAAALLDWGCMPLFPAARREWKSDEVLFIPTGSGLLSWPPKGWKNLNPDQKLLQWEYASMMLEINNSNPSPSTLHRGALLDRYNMLALPGTSVPVSSGDNLIERKAMYYNYEVLRSIVNGNKIQGDQNVKKIIEMYEAAAKCRDTTNDFIIKLIEQASIGRRLDGDHDQS